MLINIPHNRPFTFSKSLGVYFAPLALLIFIFVNNAYAQGRHERRPTYVRKHTKFGWQWVESGHTYPAWYDNCRFINRYTLQKRLNQYPFNKAVKVEAVSYPNPCANVEETIDSTGKAIRNPPFDDCGLKIVNGVLDVQDIRERKVLTQQQIENLTNIIYNTTIRKKHGTSVDPGYSCYNPRNAILFYGDDGKVFDYLEICFECEEWSSKSERLHIGSLCNQKFDLMRKWFISAGINYGTQKTQ